MNYKDIKEEKIHENNLVATKQLDEKNLFHIDKKRLFKIIMNKIKNEGNENALYKLIKEQKSKRKNNRRL